MQRDGAETMTAATEAEAIRSLRFWRFDALVLDMELTNGNAVAVADFARYRSPNMPVIAVTARSFFSDQEIFEMLPNARSVLREPVRPDDLAAVVEHNGSKGANSR